MRYLGYTVEQFEALDLPDYILLMDAVELRESDKAFWTHFLAWQTMRANGKKKAGKGYKSAFPRFKLFYDAEAAMKNIKKNKEPKKSRFSGLGSFLKNRIKEEGGEVDG